MCCKPILVDLHKYFCIFCILTLYNINMIKHFKEIYFLKNSSTLSISNLIVFAFFISELIDYNVTNILKEKNKIENKNASE